MVPIAHAAHPVNAQRVLNWILGPEVQSRMAEQGAIVPVNATVQLTPALMARLGFGNATEIPRFRPLDVETINDKFGDWSERFDKLMSKPR